MSAHGKPEPRPLTDHELDVLVALLTLDTPEVIATNRARWTAIAEQARADMRRPDRVKP